MDRLHLKCALVDLIEHGWVILESEDDAKEVVEAARKLGRATKADRRPSPYLDRFYWVVTSSLRMIEEKAEKPVAKPVQEPVTRTNEESTSKKTHSKPILKRYVWKRS